MTLDDPMDQKVCWGCNCSCSIQGFCKQGTKIDVHRRYQAGLKLHLPPCSSLSWTGKCPQQYCEDEYGNSKLLARNDNT